MLIITLRVLVLALLPTEGSLDALIVTDGVDVGVGSSRTLTGCQVVAPCPILGAVEVACLVIGQ